MAVATDDIELQRARALAMANARMRAANAAPAKPPAFVGPPVPEPYDPWSFAKGTWEGAKGLGEMGAAIGTGMVTSPVNHLQAALAEAQEQKPGDPLMSAYEPKSEVGQLLASKLGNALAPIAGTVDQATGLNDPDPGIRATGHLINAGVDLLPGASMAKRLAAAGRIRAGLIPTGQALREGAQTAYKTAETSGEILPRTKLEEFVPKAEDMLAEQALNKTLHPNTTAALNHLYDEAIAPGQQSAKSKLLQDRIAARTAPESAPAAQPQTVDEWIAGLGKAATKDATPQELNTIGFSPKGAETIRRVLGDAEDKAFGESPPGKPSADYRLAAKLKDQFDDFLEENMPATTAAGKEARQKWSTYRKVQDIEDLVERATNQAGGFAQSGMENALRTKFKQLADNPRRFSRYTPDEQAAILKVVRNGPLMSTARQIGKLSPARGGIPLYLEALTALAHPSTAYTVLGLAGAGEIGKQLAELLRKGRANAVSDLVRVGGKSENVPGLLENMPALGAEQATAQMPAYIDAATQDRARRLAQTLR